MVDSEHAEKSFQTYVHYLDAWELCVRNSEQLFQRQLALAFFQKSSPKTTACSPELLKSLVRRGQLTVDAMCGLPIKRYPELALGANLWIGVQAYYAIYAFGLACSECLQPGHSPKTHASFLKLASKSFMKLLPFPFNVSCRGDVESKNWSISNTTVSESQVTALQQLEVPNSYSAELYIAKSLKGTHRDRFQRKRADFLRTNKKKKLSSKAKLALIKNLESTTVFDFIYGLRVRSNYDDPAMFLAGEERILQSIRFYENCVALAIVLELLMSRAIEQLAPQAVGIANLRTTSWR